PGGRGTAGSGGLATGGHGAAGAGGAASAGRGGGGAGGAASCEHAECLRAVRCVTACGATPVSVGCCPCVAPAFDEAASCGAGGAGGTASYLGCRFIGGVDRYVVAKRDVARNLCFGLVLDSPGHSPASFLTLPTGLGLEGVSVGPAASCPSRAVNLSGPPTVGGSVTQVAVQGGGPSVLDVDVTVNYTADGGVPASEQLTAAGVDVTPACP
ncbi:MAG TPA: hypothetical protein VHM31_18475, partial [Polyangia bacterium]|nr:hypothetical protein [Polyangia bacterium]